MFATPSDTTNAHLLRRTMFATPSEAVFDHALLYVDVAGPLMTLNKAWAASELFWRALVRRVVVVHKRHAPIDGDDVALLESSWKAQFLATTRKLTGQVAAWTRFRPVVRSAGGADKFVAPKIIVPLHQRVAMLQEKEKLSKKEALRQVTKCEQTVRSAVLRIDPVAGRVLTISKGSGLREFRFPAVLDESSTQQDAYNLVRPLLSEMLNGRNATVLAYGQTGAGKSYTIMSGIVPRALEEIFAWRRMANCQKDVTMSYVQIDGDDVRDLLDDQNLRKAAAQRFILQGKAAVTVSNFDEGRQFLAEAGERRKIATTHMNETSSRAHTVIVFTVGTASLFIADLGGSERQHHSKAGLVRDAANINLGLFALQRCVLALRRGSAFVPFASSKLTQILRRGLLGDRTGVFICCAPEPRHAAETVHSLRFAEQLAGLETQATPEPDASIRAAVDSIDTQISAVEALIRQKERWVTRERVVESNVTDYDEDAPAFVKSKLNGRLKWHQVVPVNQTSTTVSHVVKGRVLTGAEIERRTLEKLLEKKATLLEAI